MDIKQVEAFVSVATTRSFRATANRLHITQPAVSSRIASLEAELGAALFDRGNGTSVELTSAGAGLLPVAEQLLQAAQRLKAQAPSRQREFRKIRLGTTSTLANGWIPGLLSGRAGRFPNLTIDLIAETSAGIRELFLDCEVDIAIIMGPTHAPGVRNVPLTSYGTSWIASRHLGLPGVVALETLVADHRIVTHARDSDTYRSLEDLLRSRDLWPAPLFTTTSTGALMRMVSSGAAVGFASEICLRDQLSPVVALQLAGADTGPPVYSYFASYHMDSADDMGAIVGEMAQRVCRGAGTETA